MVKKKNGKWRICVDFTDLNKACPKNSFPLPHIDQLIDATAGHELLSFLDAYSGYNQILMEEEDQDKTTFITYRGTYCYRVMPFGLKNAGATYQRLVTKMFKDHLRKTMEVYIDDMLVKSVKAEDYINHLKEAFDILKLCEMKLNPEKCMFGATYGKLLGFLVSQRGIEVKPDQIKAIEGIPELLTTKRQVQRFTGRIIALSRFISWSCDRCHKFFGVLKKDNDLEWTPECVQAL
uniref:RNA-directed DNA polymerase homolog n=1 Tax=Nicotiana tabacum TaxID=4097 RepID=A0A1S4B5K1_TOBAC|nr:PREDICTED: RNA-directed DNA polymerase homolog [Nicotiana tabacum]